MGRWKASFGPKYFEVHPTNSQSVPSPITGLEYIKSFATNPLWGPLRPSVGIIAHLVVSDLLIYSFSLRELTHTREILDPIMKGTFYISFVVQPYIACSPNSKGQIKGIKIEGMTLKLWYTLRFLWDKRKEVLTY